jgi:hypothetical protein
LRRRKLWHSKGLLARPTGRPKTHGRVTRRCKVAGADYGSGLVRTIVQSVVRAIEGPSHIVGIEGWDIRARDVDAHDDALAVLDREVLELRRVGDTDNG